MKSIHKKNRTQLVADLLTSAIDELEKNLPEAVGEAVEDARQEYLAEQLGETERLYYLSGVRGKFHHLTNNRYSELEKSRGCLHDMFSHG